MMQLRFTALLIPILSLTGCTTLELGTAISLTYRPPFTDFKATKDGVVQIEGKFKFVTDPDSANFVPHNPNDPGELIIYAVDEAQYPMAYKAQEVLRDHQETDKFFGGPDWDMTSHTDFSFTVDRAAYRAYCAGDGNFDISIWVKANAAKPFQRLVDEKGIDKFLSGQLKGDCKKPDTNLITPDK